jgi:CHAT domain-containing protein
MRKYGILIILLLNSIIGYAQMQQEIEKNVETAAIAIRGILMNNQNIDCSAHIDTLEKYLHKEPASLKLSVKYFAVFTLNGYYLEKQIPGVDYKELIEALLVTQKFDSFYDPFYINCAYGSGIEYENRGLYVRSIDTYELTLKAFAKVYQGNHSLFDYNIQKRIAMLYYLRLNNMPEWLVAQKKATDIIEQIAGKENETYIKDLDELSLAYQLNNQYEKSDSCLFIRQNYFERNNLQHSIEYTELLDKRANAQRMLFVPQYKEAINLYEKILSLQKDGTPEYANTLFEMAACYREMEDLKKTKFYADKSAAIAQKNPNENIDLLFNLIPLYKNSNGIEQVRKLISLSFDPKDNLFLLSKMAYMYALVDNFPQSRKYVEQAKIQADKRISSGDVTFDFSNELGELSNALIVLDEYGDVIKYQEISMDITKRTLGENHAISRQMHILLSGMYPLTGDFDKALDILDALVQDKDAPDYLEILHKQADLYASLGNFDKAIPAYKTILAAQPNPLTEWNILLSLTGNYVSIADLLRGEKKNDEALSPIDNAQEYASQLLKFSEKEFGINSEQYILSLNQVAAVYCLRDSIETAQKYADICLNVIDRNHFGDLERASYLGSLAFVYAEMKDFSKAIELGEKTKKIQQKINSENCLEEDFTLQLLSESYLGNNNFEKAQSCYTGLYKNLSNKILRNFSYMPERQRENFWRMYQKQFYNAGKFIDVSNKKDTFATIVYDASLFSKGILLNSSIELKNLLKETGNAKVIKLYAELENTQKLLDNTDKMPADKARTVLVDSLQKVIYTVERQLLKESKVYGDYTRNLSIKWQDIQKVLSDNDIAIEFIDYSVGKDSVIYAALVLQKEGIPQMIPLFDKKNLESILLDRPNKIYFIDAISNKYHQDLIYQSSALSKLIWLPLQEAISNKGNIYFSPSGILHQLGIEYLPIGNDKRPINELYNLCRLSSTKQLALDRKKINSKSAIIYGGLKYDTDTTTLINISRQYRRDLIVHSDVQTVSSIARAGITATYLPGTKAEADAIFYQLQKIKQDNDSVVLYTDTLGTEESFKNLSGKKKNIMHIATHGFFYTEPEIRRNNINYFMSKLSGQNQMSREEKSLNHSGLLMSGADIVLQDTLNNFPKGIDDGILTAKEIAYLDLRDLDLVVLSACQTGLGEISGEGVFGLQRAFKKAGAQTLVMSLWKVYDKATEIIMTAFYDNLSKGQSKHIAFLNAQKYLKEKPEFSKPQFWAAFILLD